MSPRNAFPAAALAAALAAAACASARVTTGGAGPAATTAPGSASRAPLSLQEVPLTRTVDQVDDYHGTKVADPYRWLEDTGGPGVREWIEAQNARAFAWLGSIPERPEIHRRVKELWDFERFGVPRREGGRLFFSRNDGLQDQSVLLVQDGDGAAPRVLLDPNALSADGTVSLSQWEPSPDGNLLGYALSGAGSDWVEWRVREVESGKDRPDLLKWSKFSGLSWARDGSGFWYSRYAAPAAGKEYAAVLENQKLCFHRLGDAQEKDAVVYERPDHPRWGFGGQVTEDGRFLVIYVWEGSQPENRIYVRDLADPAGRVEPLLDAGDASYEFVDNDGASLFVLTRKDAPRGRVVAIDAAHPSPDRWREVIPEAPETLQSISVVGDRFVALYMKDARSEVRVFSLGGAPERTVTLPGTGTATEFSGRRGRSEGFFAYTDFFTPAAILRCDPATGTTTPFREPKVGFDRARFETRQIFYESRDGTRIPMFVSHLRGLPLDGERPVLLYGYGGFDVSLTPFFSVSNLVWMERGGVVAIPNIRGGGEYGEEWHKSAILENRHRCFEDFIAAGEWLIKRRYTRPGKLAISGGSNGGLLVGACMTRRPDLFGAALPSVGVMDMLRYHKFTIGWAWAAEYGTSDDAAQFRTLLSYSPLHNLRPGTAYPPTMVTTSDHDDRVVPGHSFKFAAALQAAQGGPAPVLLRVDVKSGHGAGTPTRMLVERAADQIAFLVEAMGAR